MSMNALLQTGRSRPGPQPLSQGPRGLSCGARSALLALSLLVLCPLHAQAQFLIDAEHDATEGRWAAIAGTGLESSPRLALGARWRLSDTLPRVEQPLTLTLALTSPIWLVPSGDHLGVLAGARYSVLSGPVHVDFSVWNGFQAWDNGIAKGSSWSLAGAVLPGFHHGRSFVGLRLGARFAYLTHIRHLEDWTRWVDARDGWYRWTAASLDATLRGGTRLAPMVRVEAEFGTRLPLDFAPLTPFELPWIVGLRFVVAPPSGPTDSVPRPTPEPVAPE